MRQADERRIFTALATKIDGMCPCPDCRCGCLAHAITVRHGREWAAYRIDLCGHCQSGGCRDEPPADETGHEVQA